MPKRTNDFQELVDLIHRALVPKGAKIGSSVMLPSSTGDMREIDVLIESDIGPYCIKIAVEAKDHNRKLDVTEIDNLIGKYTDGKLNINKIIIVSHSGFTDLAYKKAVNSHLDIELKTLKEAKEISWDDKIPQDIILNIPPHLLDIKLSSSNELPNNPQILKEGMFYCRCCGKEHGTPLQLMQRLVWKNKQIMNRINKEAIERGKNNDGVCAKVEMGICEKWMLRYQGEEYRIEKILAHIHSINASSKLNFCPYEFDDKTIQYVHANVAGKKIELALPDGLRSQQIALRISDNKVKNKS